MQEPGRLLIQWEVQGGHCMCYPQWMQALQSAAIAVATRRRPECCTHWCQPGVVGRSRRRWRVSYVGGRNDPRMRDIGSATRRSAMRFHKRPRGPKALDVAEGVWGHEPTAARAPTGEYALFWTANFGKEVPCTRVSATTAVPASRPACSSTRQPTYPTLSARTALRYDRI